MPEDHYEPPPLPWRIVTDHDATGRVTRHRIQDATGRSLFAEGFKFDHDTLCDSDLFPTIIRAINARDAMLAALRTIAAIHPRQTYARPWLEHAISTAQAAIQIAEESPL